MPRSKNSVPRKKYVKKILKRAKGFMGRRTRVFKLAQQHVIRAGRFAFHHRKKKRSGFRALWSVRINAALEEQGVSYSRFIHALKLSNVLLNRKSLAELAATDKDAFLAVLDQVKSKLATK
jgi:large subunit ribosomal protein L20